MPERNRLSKITQEIINTFDVDLELSMIIMTVGIITASVTSADLIASNINPNLLDPAYIARTNLDFIGLIGGITALATGGLSQGLGVPEILNKPIEIHGHRLNLYQIFFPS